METDYILHFLRFLHLLNLPYLGMETGTVRESQQQQTAQSSLFRNGNRPKIA